MKNGETLDKFENIVSSESPEGHIPLSEFIDSRDWTKITEMAKKSFEIFS